MGGPTDKAIDVDELAHDIKYPAQLQLLFLELFLQVTKLNRPAEVDTFATKVTNANANK